MKTSVAINRAKKENVYLPSQQEILEKYITDSPPYNYIRLQKIQTGQLGINPIWDFSNPVGVYAYPLTTERFQIASKNKHEYAGDYALSYIFAAKNPNKILYLDNFNIQEEINKLKEGINLIATAP